jgi:hypothetical protein
MYIQRNKSRYKSGEEYVTPLYLTLFVAVMLFTACDKNNNEVTYSFSRNGGWIGLYEHLTINATTTQYSISYHELRTTETKSYQTTVKTSNKLWGDLTKTFDLGIFKKIKDGGCLSCVDLYDETFSVIIDNKTYSIYNGDSDEHFKQIQIFFDEMYEQVESFESLAGFRL